uniref:Dynamin-binding protein n=1 Tax=Globodera rostochiensis TaxID=31243 RepID=A0A914I8N6_GLORO
MASSLYSNATAPLKESDANFSQLQQHIYDFPTEFSCSKSTLSLEEGLISNDSSCLERNRPYCRALYDFRSDFPNELGFSAGDLIFIERRANDEWLEGECQSNGRRGLFPQTFVDIVVPLHGEEAVSISSAVQFTSAAIEDDSNDQIGVASVLYDFEPRFPDELPLRAGESVQVLQLVSTEWVKCREPTNGLVGVAPQSFLHIFLDTANEGTNQFVELPLSLAELSENSEKDATRPWDVSLFQSSDLQQSTGLSSTCPSVVGTASAAGTASEQIVVPPPPRPPPPKLPPATESAKLPSSTSASSSSVFSTKSSSKKASSLRKKQSKVTSSAKRQSFQPHQHSVELVDEADESLVVGVSSAGREVQGVHSKSSNPHLLVQNATMNAAVSQSESKQKVVLDLLNTERSYLFDLNTWEMSIQESAELGAEDKKALTNGYVPLKQLSQTLIATIEAHKDLPSGDQHFGQSFMELKDRFFGAYAYHFRYVEQISIIVENEEDAPLQKALQKCLLAIRQRGSNVFDVPTAVSRPIQRCLKYPLYIGELLKNTPIQHPDHPKLMESLRQFGTLASRMNECKRRKELIRKYRTQEQLSLADRLSRINMHSLVKKSNRLKYRINRSIGLSTVRYTEFDYLVQLLEEAERRLCKFLYCAQLYKKQIEQSVKRHEDSYKGVCHAQDENVVKAFATMFRRLDELCRRYLQTFDQEVITEGKKLVRSDLAKLVHKRFDKLADYEIAKTTNKNSEEVEMRRAEFEALNNQIKTQLPRVIGTINSRVLELIQRVSELDSGFLRRLDEWFANERPERVRDCFNAALPFRAHLSASHRQTLTELNRIAAHLSSGTNALHRKKSLRLSLRGPKTNPHRHNDGDEQQKRPKAQKIRAQTMKERDALMKICHAQKQSQQLRRVQCDWEGASMVLKQGDAVLVKAHRQDGFSLCDNAVTTGLVPVNLLVTENGPYAITSADQSQPNSFDAPLLLLDFCGSHASQDTNQTNRALDKITANSVKYGKNEKNDVDLIDLEDNLIDLDSPPKIDVQPRELKPISSSIGDQIKPFPLEDYEQEPGNKRGSSSSPPVPPIPDRPMSSLHQHLSLPMPILSTTSFSSTPVRIAPPPPAAHRRRDITPQRQAVAEPVEEQLHLCFGELSNPTDDELGRHQILSPFSSSLFAICVFDFTPVHNSNRRVEGHQLTIREGDVVEVLRRHDDGGNTEWWLIRRIGQQNGMNQQQQGYVPANYLSCLDGPNNTRFHSSLSG